MNKIVRWLVNHFLFGNLVDPIFQIGEKLKGHKTQILVSLLLIIHLCEIFGLIDKESGDKVEQVLAVLLGPALYSKFQRERDLKNDLLEKITASSNPE